jgi:hypothetical protein
MSDIVIPETTEQVISRSTFRLGEVYVWASVREARDALYDKGRHLMIVRDEKETTVVTSPENLASLDVLDVNRDRWVLIAIDCANPFYCVGFIAKVAARLSAAGIDILAVSTFSRDLFFVKEEDGSRAADALRAIGFAEGS